MFLIVIDTYRRILVYNVTGDMRSEYQWLWRGSSTGTSVDYWPVTAKQGEVHHPACSNANPNHNTNLNPSPNPTADPN